MQFVTEPVVQVPFLSILLITLCLSSPVAGLFGAPPSVPVRGLAAMPIRPGYDIGAVPYQFLSKS